MTDDTKKKRDALEGRLQDIMDPPAMRAIRRQQERLQDLVNPPALRAIRRLQDLVDPPAMRAIREQQKRLQDVVDPPALRAIREQQKRLQDLIDPPALRAIREQQQRMRDLIDSWSHPLLATTDFAQLTAAFNLGAPAVESALRGAHLEDQAQIAGIAASGLTKLFPVVSPPGLQESGELLSAGVEFLASPFDSGPADLVSDVPSEVFRALDVDATLSGAADTAEGERLELRARTVDILEAELAAFDRELVRLLAGARTAAQSNNPDKLRHVCVSLRELLGHALRQLAPDTAIRAWTQDAAHFHEGRPTRRARLEYLYKGAGEPALEKLIAADIRGALELFDTLSNGTHVATFAASEAALLVLLSRAEGVLLLLLRLRSRGGGGV